MRGKRGRWYVVGGRWKKGRREEGSGFRVQDVMLMAES
jgi:hypothetical protein